MTEEKDLEIELLTKDIKDWHLHYNGRINTILTKVESQKETIDEQYMTISTANIWNSKLKDEIESLKAITELAVKGLDFYASFWNHDVQLEDIGITSMQRDRGLLARTTLSEIEKLQK